MIVQLNMFSTIKSYYMWVIASCSWLLWITLQRIFIVDNWTELNL